MAETHERRMEALKLEVALRRLAGVQYPCLVCGGRGDDGWTEDVFELRVQCGHCAGTGEEPSETLRQAAYGSEATP